MSPFTKWRPKGKFYNLKCTKCGHGFLSGYSLNAPFCGNCLQTAKSLDSTIDYDVKCSSCGNVGVIYSKKSAILVILD
jgi:ribosomal protein S27E